VGAQRPFSLAILLASCAPAFGGPAAPAASDPAYLRALVVQSFHDEDGSIVLQLDRGLSAGLRPGQEGRLLDAATGEQTLVPGATFTVEQVPDADHATARSRDVVSNGTFMRNRHAVIAVK
jgi:hypothetical protein